MAGRSGSKGVVPTQVDRSTVSRHMKAGESLAVPGRKLFVVSRAGEPGIQE